MINRSIKLLLSVVFLSVILHSCKTAQPVAPTASYQKPVERVKEISTFNIPVEIPISEIVKTINAQLGTVLYEDNSLTDNGGDNLIVKVNKTGSIQISPKGNALQIGLPLNIYIKTGFSKEVLGMKVENYKDTKVDLNIRFATQLGLDGNWNVTTKTESAGHDLVNKPSINIAGIDIPITPIVDRVIKYAQPEIAKAIDENVKGKINVKQYANQAWTLLQDPVSVNETYKVWLKISPTDLYITPLGFRGNNIKTTIGLKAITETYIGTQPQKSQIPLPALKTVTTVDERIQLGLIGEISYAEAQKIAFDQVKDQTFEFQNGKKKVKIAELSIYGQNEMIIVATTLVGSISGKIFLKGKPVYDAASQSIIVESLDYELDTKNKLAKSADWLAHDKFVKLIEPYFKVPISKQLNDAKSMIQKNLNNNKVNKNLQVNGKLDELVPNALYVTPNGIQAVIMAKGKIELLINGL